MKLIIYKKQINIIPKWMLYLISWLDSLLEFVMFLFSYYKAKVVT
jgi:hypothetical protein